MQVDCQDFLSTSLMQVFSTTCSKSANIKLPQADFHDKMHNRRRVCGVPCCVENRALINYISALVENICAQSRVLREK